MDEWLWGKTGAKNNNQHTKYDRLFPTSNFFFCPPLSLWGIHNKAVIAPLFSHAPAFSPAQKIDRLHTALQLKKWGEMWEIGRESLENGEAIADSYLLYVH